MTGKCPKCGSLVAKLDGHLVDVHVGIKDTFRVITYSCTSCHAVLGCQMDPTALECEVADKTVEALLAKLRKAPAQ